jgi:hypothetical protein
MITLVILIIYCSVRPQRQSRKTNWCPSLSSLGIGKKKTKNANGLMERLKILKKKINWRIIDDTMDKRKGTKRQRNGSQRTKQKNID